jgi:hypothetical protein
MGPNIILKYNHVFLTNCLHLSPFDANPIVSSVIQSSRHGDFLYHIEPPLDPQAFPAPSARPLA